MPADDTAKAKRRRRLSDLVAAGAFNAALLAAPFLGAGFYQRIHAAPPVVYDGAAVALAGTREALERFGGRIQRHTEGRSGAWRELVRAELDEGDAAAARGFVLAAPGMLGPADAASLKSALPASATDAAILAGAQRFLAAPERDALNRLVGAGRFRQDARAALARYAAADPGALASALQAFAEGHGGLAEGALAAVGPAAPVSTYAAAGAGLLRAALRDQTLHPDFQVLLRLELERVLPEARLRASLAKAAFPLDADAAAAAAREALDEAAFARLQARLESIGAMAAFSAPAGAAALITHARSLEDLDRLRQIAEAGGDRAYAIAKRADPRAGLALTARGRYRPDRRTTALALGLAFAGLAAGAALARTVANHPLRRARKITGRPEVLSARPAPSPPAARPAAKPAKPSKAAAKAKPAPAAKKAAGGKRGQKKSSAGKKAARTSDRHAPA